MRSLILRLAALAAFSLPTAARCQMQTLDLDGATAAKGLVINEIYIGTTISPLGSSDQFIELYNPQTTTQYLDGNIIVHFGSGGKVTGGAIQQPVEAWKFPGKLGGKTQPVAPGKFIVIAPTAKAFTNGVDLSGANYETYTGIPIVDQDNASATNLTKVAASGLFTQDLTLSATQDIVVLATGSDTVLTNGIDVSSVIDGVQYALNYTKGPLPATIDAGVTGGAGLALGISMERKVKGGTTFNSKTDFTLVPPTPGFQHGTESSGGATKVTDIFPLDRNRYVQYDEFQTDTTGAPIATSKTEASYTVFGTNVNFGGDASSIWVRDTSGAAPGLFMGGTANDLHYRATAKGDLQVFADTSFMQLFVPSAIAASVTPPNAFVDYLMMSTGLNKTYPVTSINQNITQSGISIAIAVTATGSYLGVEPVTVPKGTFDSAYKFMIKANIKASAALIGTLMDIDVPQQIWIVKGIGIVKSNAPSVNSSQVNIPGSERDMTAFGVRGASGVVSSHALAPVLSVFPTPAMTSVRFDVPQSSRSIKLYSTDGREVFNTATKQDEAAIELPVSNLPNGIYLARVDFSDGTFSTARVVVQH